MKTKPTEAQVDVAIEVMEWYREYLKREEPHAQGEIRAVAGAIDGVSCIPEIES